MYACFEYNSHVCSQKDINARLKKAEGWFIRLVDIKQMNRPSAFENGPETT
jgi:hypothetical protein